MRNLPESMKRKLASPIQAGDSRLSATLWVSRPTIPLTEDVLLERQLVLPSTRVTKAAVAVCHPRSLREASSVYVGYIDSGVAKITYGAYSHQMSRDNWLDSGFAEPAEDISLCFDGTMPKADNGKVEFLTEGMPWVFWTSNSTLYGKKLGSDSSVILAEANCTAVSAVRAIHSEVGKFDFGLIVFFILGGYLYYRQFLNGEWFDAELVSAGPPGVLWSDVSAFRTWDYRVGVQLRAQDGSLYELFTQFMGIGKQTLEHVQFNDVSETHSLTRIYRTSAQAPSEHIEVNDIVPAPYQFAYEIGAVKFIGVKNIDDGTGDWGRYLVLSFDKELNPTEVQDQILQFSLMDSEGSGFYPETVSMDSSGKRMTLVYPSFNNAVGDCTITYTPGTITTMVGEILPGFSSQFTPRNLVPVEGLPKVQSIWNE